MVPSFNTYSRRGVRIPTIKGLRFFINSSIIWFGDLLQSTGEFFLVKKEITQVCWGVINWDWVGAGEGCRR